MHDQLTPVFTTYAASQKFLNSKIFNVFKRQNIYKKKAVILNSKIISQYYWFCCILDQINAGLVSRREFFIL